MVPPRTVVIFKEDQTVIQDKEIQYETDQVHFKRSRKSRSIDLVFHSEEELKAAFPHECRWCGKRYATVNSLAQHYNQRKQLINGNQTKCTPFNRVCLVCTQVFPTSETGKRTDDDRSSKGG